MKSSCTTGAGRRSLLAIWMCLAPFHADAQAGVLPDPSDSNLPVPTSQYQGIVNSGNSGIENIDAPRLPWTGLFRPDGEFVPEAELDSGGRLSNTTGSAGTRVAEMADNKSPPMPGHSAYDARGVIEKIYPDRQRVKLKHGPIDKYEMPGMTMVFRVKNPALLQGIGEGDERGIKIEMDGSSFVITGFEPAASDGSKDAGQEAKTASGSDARGTVQEIYRDREKIKLKHGPIDKFEMPGMTMVFRVQDPALLDEVKEGEEVGFTIEMKGNVFVVTGFQK